MNVTLLGCGSSGGVPLIGCDCAICTSGNPKNNRTRVSVLIETGGKNLLIDTSPDLRQQALREGMKRVDAVLFTHDHADHTHGIDDLRSFNYLAGKSLDLYGNKHTMEVIQNRFAYAFQPKPETIWYRPSFTPHILPDEPIHRFSACGVAITAFQQVHGKGTTLGYRIGDFAYSTDCNHLPDTAFEALKGLDVWVVDCLRYRESPSHSTVAQTLEWIARVKPKRAVLTHMAHDLDYDILCNELPEGIVPGYDGMALEVISG